MTPDDEAPHRHRWAYPLDIPDPIRTCNCGAVQHWGPAAKGTKTPDDEAQRIAHEFRAHRTQLAVANQFDPVGEDQWLAARIREYGEACRATGAIATAALRDAEIAQLRDALERLCVATSAIEGTSIEYSKAIELSEAFRQAQRLLGREGEKK